ncbi:MAG: sulfurtransferase TusA family protein [Janthinobacterium lividum]
MTEPAHEPVYLSLDCTGLRCPRPIIEIARQIGRVPVGGLVGLLADDPATAPDLAAWCRMRGQELVSSATPRFVVRRLV